MNVDADDHWLVPEDQRRCDETLLCQLEYSRPYCGGVDDPYQIRQVEVPRDLLVQMRTKLNFTHRMLSEDEWRALGVQMSHGWTHVGYFRNECTWIFRKPNPDFVSLSVE